MSNLTHTLVPMDRSHLPQVAALERTCFPDPWSEAMLAEALYHDTVSLIVAEGPDGAVLGYAMLRVVLDEGTLERVAVNPACRRQGVARDLLGAFLRFGRVHLAFLTLEVRAGNAAAVAFYRAMGLEEVHRRRDYYSNPKEDAVLMTVLFSGGEENP